MDWHITSMANELFLQSLLKANMFQKFKRKKRKVKKKAKSHILEIARNFVVRQIAVRFMPACVFFVFIFCL